MASIEEQIRNAAERNETLLQILAETDHALPSLQKQNQYIDELLNQIAHNDVEVEKLTSSREKMRDHHKSANTRMKHLALKVTGQKGKPDEKAEKVEKQYFDAISAEHRAQEQREDLAKQLDEAMQVKMQLEPDASKHEQAQKDLDALYNSIFAGPTPLFAGEDTQELEVSVKTEAYRQIESAITVEEQARKLLVSAADLIPDATRYLNRALHDAIDDHSGIGYPSIFEETDTLRRAERYVYGMMRWVNKAHALAPYIKPLDHFEIARGAYMEDRALLEENMRDLQKAIDQLHQNQTANNDRLRTLRDEKATAMKELETSRSQLQKMREKIFEKVSGKV